MRRSLLLAALSLSLSAPISVSAHELTLGYSGGEDWYAAYYKVAYGLDETVAALVQGSTSTAIEAVGRYGLHGELDVIQSTAYEYTQVEYRIGW